MQEADITDNFMSIPAAKSQYPWVNSELNDGTNEHES